MKYEFTGETKQVGNITLRRIIAIKEFGDVKKGQIGGWIEKESNLSHEGNCWVTNNARVYGDAMVFDNAWVFGYARVYGDAMVFDNAWVFNNKKCRHFVDNLAFDTSLLCEHDNLAQSCKICELEKENAILKDQIKMIEDDEQKVWNYLKINPSNDMSWVDEIIIGINNKIEGEVSALRSENADMARMLAEPDDWQIEKDALIKEIARLKEELEIGIY